MVNIKSKKLLDKKTNIVVALSGGIDSVVLLHYLHNNFDNNIRAIHCNHHLSDNCGDWDKFCSDLCKSMNIEYLSIDIFLDNTSNFEEIARKKRYKSLSSNLKQNEILCTAHHMEDQAETILLQLLRGSGVAGLSSMPLEKKLNEGSLLRPFIDISKSQIIDYAANNKLKWIEDDSNLNTDIRRNFLRIEIIPKLSKFYSEISKSLSRSARHQSQALKLIEDLALIDINTKKLIDLNNCIEIDKISKLNDYRIINIIRYHIRSIEFTPPSEKIMEQIMSLLFAKEDASPLVCWGSFEVRRYKNKMYFIDTKEEQNNMPCPFFEKLKDLPNLSIKYRHEGQRIKFDNKSHSQSLKKILQEYGIPPWERDKIKMYYVGDKLKAIERIGEVSESP